MKMPAVEFFPIDDKVLQDAGVKFIAINEPKLIVVHNGKDNRPIEIDITSEWHDVGSKQLIEQSKPHFSGEVIDKLVIYVGNKVLVEKADLIAEIKARQSDNNNGSRNTRRRTRRRVREGEVIEDNTTATAMTSQPQPPQEEQQPSPSPQSGQPVF